MQLALVRLALDAADVRVRKYARRWGNRITGVARRCWPRPSIADRARRASLEGATSAGLLGHYALGSLLTSIAPRIRSRWIARRSPNPTCGDAAPPAAADGALRHVEPQAGVSRARS